MLCVVAEVIGQNIVWIYEVVQVGGEVYVGSSGAYYGVDSYAVKEGRAHLGFVWKGGYMLYSAIF